jgi:hypothetical protein
MRLIGRCAPKTLAEDGDSPNCSLNILFFVLYSWFIALWFSSYVVIMPFLFDGCGHADVLSIRKFFFCGDIRCASHRFLHCFKFQRAEGAHRLSRVKDRY